MLLTTALLLGQCDVSALAKEESAPAQTGTSENVAGAQEDGAGDIGSGEAGIGTDGGGAEGSDQGSGSSGTGDDDADEAGSSAGADNGGEGDADNTDSEDEGEDKGGEGDGDQCVCETACTEDAVNTACPVCAANYVVCAKNAGGGVKPSEEESGEKETVSENDLSEEETVFENDPDGENEIALLADEGVEALAVGDEFYYEGVNYRVIEAGKVETCKYRAPQAVSGTKIILESFEQNGVTYHVKRIGNETFSGCEGLTGIEIPESVTSIGYKAFQGCSSLINVEIPESVTSIEASAFFGCKSLSSIEIPRNVRTIKSSTFNSCSNLTRVKIPESVTSIEYRAFYYCKKLTSIETLKNVVRIGNEAFRWCSSLTSIEIPDGLSRIELGVFELCGLTSVQLPESVVWIGDSAFAASNLTSVTIQAGKMQIQIVDGAFENCSKLNELRIIVLSDGTFRFPEVWYRFQGGAFDGLPDERYIRFVDEDGNEITGQVYDEVFAEAAKNDDDGDDSKWYGWSYKEYIPKKDTYTVTINVKKDGTPWNGHGRTFALLGGSGFLEVQGQTGDSTYTLSQVPNGTYRVYDITGVSADALYSKARDTGAEVRVNGADTEVDVMVDGADIEKDIHYYTATFYDGTQPYPAGTPQEPQIILSGKKAAKPEDPQKEDRQFAGWKTADGGRDAYDFNTPVTAATSIYASWVEKTAEQFHITASSTEGGSISPVGDIAVTKGGEQTFTIMPNEGYRIKAVTVDGIDVTAGLQDTLARAQAGARYYTFTNVTDDHTIRAEFETDGGKPDDGDDKPDDGGDKPDDGDDKPNGGGNTSNGGGSAGGNNTPDGGGSSDGGSVQTVVAAETAPQAVTEQTAANGKEPKTGDPTPVEIYATVAMIAGLTYLLLYFMEEGRGMSEREKEVFVAAFIRWAKKGGRFRRCCAIAAIFCLLVYYHSIGKRAGKGSLKREYLRQAL